jgi:hypothetical protein
MRFLLLCFSLLVLAVCNAAGFTWPPADGQGYIVVRENPSRAERFAAEELQAYLLKRTGKAPEITAVLPGEGIPAFIIGGHAENRKYQDELEKRGADHYDSFTAVVKGNRIHLTGRNGTGIMFSVWHLLEKTGIDWLLPGKNGVYIPEVSPVSWADGEDYQIPFFEYRATSVMSGSGDYGRNRVGSPESMLNDKEHGQDASVMWAWRMRLTDRALQERDRFPNLGSGHSYDYYLPAGRYGEAHPEWYNLVNGRRLNKASDYGRQLCFTNQEAAVTFAVNYVPDIRKILETGVPLERIRISVSPNDSIARCDCENCKKIFDSTGTASSQVMHFANLVHAELVKTFPGIKVYYYVYNNHGRIPEHGKPSAGVIPDITSWTSGNGLAVNHAEPLFAPANKRYQEIYNWFAANSDFLSLYTYYTHYAFVSPFPVLTQMPDDFRHWAESGKAREYYCESHLNWGTQNITLYLMAKLLWNPYLDADQAVRDYCRKAYGAAADELYRYHMVLQKQMDSLAVMIGDPQEIPGLLTPEVVKNCNQLLAAAEAKIPQMDEYTAWRTRLAVEAWRYSALLAEIFREVNTNRDPERREAIKEKILKFREFCQSDLGRWAFEHRMTTSLTPLNGVNFDLRAVPEGKDQVWSDSFYNGGTSKMYFKLKNARPDRWGYLAAAEKPVSLELPVKAAPGLVIADLTFRFNGDAAAKNLLTITADDGSSWETDSFIGRELKLPESLQGKKGLTFRFNFTVAKKPGRADHGYVLHRGNMKITTQSISSMN